MTHKNDNNNSFVKCSARNNLLPKTGGKKSKINEQPSRTRLKWKLKFCNKKTNGINWLINMFRMFCHHIRLRPPIQLLDWKRSAKHPFPLPFMRKMRRTAVISWLPRTFFFLRCHFVTSHEISMRKPKNSSTRYEVQTKFKAHTFNAFFFFSSFHFVLYRFFSLRCCSSELWAKNVNARGTISVSYHLKYRWYRHLFAKAQCRSKRECDGDNNKKNPIDVTWQSGEGERKETASGSKVKQLNSHEQYVQ